jgi:hypothetical protein
MGQKLLLLISIILLFSVSSRAEDDGGFPELPVGSTIEIMDESVDSETSMWQKIKAFFGFGEKANVENEQRESEQKIVSDDLPIIDQANLDEDLIDRSVDTPFIPEGNVEEGPLPEREIKTESAQLESASEPQSSIIKNDVDSSDLSLPKGFDDSEDLKLPGGFSETDIDSNAANITDINEQIDLAPKSAKIPTILSEDNAKIANDLNADIADTVGDLEIPAGFDDAKSTESAILELPTIDDNQVDASLISESVDENILKIEQVASKLPLTPDYAETPDLQEEQDTAVSKLAKAFEDKKANKIELPKINENDFAENDEGKIIKQESVELDSAQLLFINNETKVLILPNDGVVLGEETEEEKLDDLDLDSYIDIFWLNYYKLQREPKKEEIEIFINNYDENFNEEDYVYLEGVAEQALNQAFEAIDKGDIISLASLVNSYPIIGLPDDRNNTLLHRAAQRGNYSAVKLLLMKGAELDARNSDNENALKIARKYRHKNISNLLLSAGLK